MSEKNDKDVLYFLNKYSTTDKNIWGPHYWFVIHNFSATYPDIPSKIDIEIAKLFIKILPFLLPCGECSSHCFQYIKNINQKKADEIVSSRYNLFNFFYELHNNVNTFKNK